MLSSNLDCHQLHDRAFGIAGITRSAIPVDYELPLPDLLIDLVAQIFLSLRRDVVAPAGAARPLTEHAAADILPSLLSSLVTAFELRMHDLFVLLLLQEVAAYFTPDFTSTKLYLLFENAAYAELDRSAASSSSADGDSAPQQRRRRWYDPRRRERPSSTTEQQFSRDVETQTKTWGRRILQAYVDNEKIRAPWPGKEGKEDLRTFRNWAHEIRLRCEAIERRYDEQEEEARR